MENKISEFLLGMVYGDPERKTAKRGSSELASSIGTRVRDQPSPVGFDLSGHHDWEGADVFPVPLGRLLSLWRRQTPPTQNISRVLRLSVIHTNEVGLERFCTLDAISGLLVILLETKVRPPTLGSCGDLEVTILRHVIVDSVVGIVTLLDTSVQEGGHWNIVRTFRILTPSRVLFQRF